MLIDILLKKLAKPAQRAIQDAGITRLEDFAKYHEREIRELHGIGRNAMSIINSIMKENRLSFKDQQ